jgi:hypothetical protein
MNLWDYQLETKLIRVVRRSVRKKAALVHLSLKPTLYWHSAHTETNEIIILSSSISRSSRFISEWSLCIISTGSRLSLQEEVVVYKRIHLLQSVSVTGREDRTAQVKNTLLTANFVRLA